MLHPPANCHQQQCEIRSLAFSLTTPIHIIHIMGGAHKHCCQRKTHEPPKIICSLHFHADADDTYRTTCTCGGSTAKTKSMVFWNSFAKPVNVTLCPPWALRHTLSSCVSRNRDVLRCVPDPPRPLGPKRHRKTAMGDRGPSIAISQMINNHKGSIWIHRCCWIIH